MNEIHRLSAAVSLFALAACLPIPHTSERFPAVRGRVVDATTLQPIAGAEVNVSDHPSVHATTAADGTFRFRKRRNFHFGYSFGMCSDDLPTREEWPVEFDVGCAGYERRVDVQPFEGCFPSLDDGKVLQAPDIQLVRSGS